METLLTKVIEEMQRQAKVCETVTQDKTQETLTDGAGDTDQNTQGAKDGMIKSKVWLEAEVIARGFLTGWGDRRMNQFRCLTS